MTDRVGKLREKLSQYELENLLVTDILNVRYLSGFTGSYAALLVTEEDVFLLTDFRYVEQVKQECPGVTLEIVERSWLPGVHQLAERMHIRSIGFEANALDYADWQTLSGSLPFTQLVPVSENPISELRMVKDAGELESIREAVRIADRTYEHVSGIIRPGISERDIAIAIECFMRKSGAEKEGFGTIVAAGARSALPHGKPTDARIREGEIVLMDFGCVWNGYHSDITRTNVIGLPDARQEEIYGIVLEAQSKAMQAIRPGILGRDIHAVAADYIASKGYGERFGHGLGHGLGLDIHDAKILSSQSNIALERNMVVTVEPGIYIPGWGGIRIEDDIVVTETGAEILTKSPRSLSLA